MVLNELMAPSASELPVRAFAEHLLLGTGFTDDGSQDSVLEFCLRAAMAAIEARIGKALIARPFRWKLTRWRAVGTQGLPVAPVTQVVSVTIIDGTGVEKTVDPGRYWLEADATRPRLRGTGDVLPAIPEEGHAELVLEAGFGAWEAIPADIRQAVLMLAASYYEDRSGSGGMPFAVLSLLEKYRAIRLLGDL